MNTKHFLLLATAFTCATGGISAATTQMTEQEIAQAIINREISVNDSVLYDGAVYTVKQFDARTNDSNNNYQDISYTLEKPVKFLDIVWGQDIVSITVTDGNDPLQPYDKIRNADATTDNRYSVNVYRHRDLNDKLLATTITAAIGCYAYVFTKVMFTRPIYM